MKPQITQEEYAQQVVRIAWRRWKLYQAARVLMAAAAGYAAGTLIERGRQLAADDLRPAGPQ